MRCHALVALLLCAFTSASAQNAPTKVAPAQSSPAGSSKVGQSPSQEQANQWSQNPREWNYGQKALARAFGNIGGWWSFLTEPEKAAFLDGYKDAMGLGLRTNGILCTVLEENLKTSSTQAFVDQMSMAIAVCEQSGKFSGFEKVTVKDLDEFYSDRMNQPILLEWSMEYLRDKATGSKTEGQLLDALKAEQKDIHDCTKYANLCKLGMPDSAPR